MQLIAVLIQGILLGSLYGLAACGLSFVFGVMSIINLAHAEFIMFGAYTTFFLAVILKMNTLLTLPISMGLIGLFAILIYLISLKRVVGENQLVTLILTYAISAFLWNFAQVAFSSTFRSVPYSLGSVAIFGSYFPITKIMSLIIIVLLIAGLQLFLKWTSLGKAIRAVSQNANIAAICGINVQQVKMIGFGMGGALAGVAGGLIAFQWSVFPLMGQDLMLKCFAIVAIGGLGSLPGAFVGGIILGLAESIGTAYWDATMANVIAPLLLIVTFLFRPQGLFGMEERVD